MKFIGNRNKSNTFINKGVIFSKSTLKDCKYFEVNVTYPNPEDDNDAALPTGQTNGTPEDYKQAPPQQNKQRQHQHQHQPQHQPQNQLPIQHMQGPYNQGGISAQNNNGVGPLPPPVVPQQQAQRRASMHLNHNPFYQMNEQIFNGYNSQNANNYIGNNGTYDQNILNQKISNLKYKYLESQDIEAFANTAAQETKQEIDFLTQRLKALNAPSHTRQLQQQPLQQQQQQQQQYIFRSVNGNGAHLYYYNNNNNNNNHNNRVPSFHDQQQYHQYPPSGNALQHINRADSFSDAASYRSEGFK